MSGAPPTQFPPATKKSGLRPGDVLEGRYEVLEELGRGGFSIVYKARQLSTDQTVALKVLKRDTWGKKRKGAAQDADVRIARFKREMQLISKLKHPNIVRLIDSGSLDHGGLYMVLEFIEGEDLSVALEREGALSEREARHLMTQVLDALAAAHALGIVHRDLKPANIMLTTSGYRRNATVLDFGIAAIMSTARGTDYITLTRGSKIHGTPAYMAPEQLRSSKPTPQTDLYAWGLVFLECLTGKRVVDGDNPMDIALQQVSNDPIPIPPGLVQDDVLQHVLATALAKPLEKRFDSTENVIAVLEGHEALSTAAIGRMSQSDLPARAGGVLGGSASALVGAIESADAQLLDGDLDDALAAAQRQLDDAEPLGRADTLDMAPPGVPDTDAFAPPPYTSSPETPAVPASALAPAPDPSTLAVNHADTHLIERIQDAEPPPPAASAPAAPPTDASNTPDGSNSDWDDHVGTQTLDKLSAVGSARAAAGRANRAQPGAPIPPPPPDTDASRDSLKLMAIVVVALVIGALVGVGLLLVRG